MRFFYLTVLVSSVLLTWIDKPDDDYWKNARMDSSPLFDVFFTDDTGYAVSNNNILFLSYDNGNNWNATELKELPPFSSKEFIWSARICCSSLKTTDGGESWVPCSPESQDRFCRVFLKDPNTDCLPAADFLNTVSKKVFSALLNGAVEVLKHPCQYTEYYSSKDEGWAPGWYISDLMTFETISKLK